VKNVTSFGTVLLLFVAWLSMTVLSACDINSDSMKGSTNGADPMENRIRILEDREEIRQMLFLYGRHLDRRDFASFSMLFSENEGEWIGGMGRAKGKGEIRGLMEEKIGSIPADSPATGFHLFMNESIDIEGDRAWAVTKWVFMIRNSKGSPEPLYLGHYEDTIVREKEGWKFLRRVVYSDIPKDDPWMDQQ